MISIITVVFNDPIGLRSTAKSIEKQSLSDFEWIVVDGASSDDTLKEVAGFSKVIPVIYSEEDEGIYDAMNKGVNVAKGEYLIFMNAGDSFANQSVLEMLKCKLASESVDVLLGGTYQHINKCVFYRVPKKINWIVHGLPAFHQSTVYKADLIQKRNYNLKFSLLADYEWLAKRCIEGVTVGYLDSPISNFFVGGSSYTNIRLKFTDSYKVKHVVLCESKIWSFVSSVHAIGKTIFVMFFLHKICAFSKVFERHQQVKKGREKLIIEYYKYPET